MNKYRKVLIALTLASSFLMTACIAPKNHEKSIPEKIKDHDRQLD